MIEYSEDFSQIYEGKEALKQRVETRLKHTTRDIPYYVRGVDIEEFTYGNPTASIKLAFRDLGPNVSFDSSNSRIKTYDLEFDTSNLMEVN